MGIKPCKWHRPTGQGTGIELQDMGIKSCKWHRPTGQGTGIELQDMEITASGIDLHYSRMFLGQLCWLIHRKSYRTCPGLMVNMMSSSANTQDTWRMEYGTNMSCSIVVVSGL